MNIKKNRIENIVLKDLLENNGEQFVDLNKFIMNKFKMEKEDYICWLDEGAIRIYEDLDCNAVLDSWFGVQGFDGVVDVNEDRFIIVPPIGYEDMYRDMKLEYVNNNEGLKEAFLNSILKDNVVYINIKGKDIFICIDEI